MQGTATTVPRVTGHPKGLYRLFFIEMWERLAFYTMVGILLLYTINTDKGGLGLPKQVGNEIYGLYLAFVYFTPYLGGLIADRFLGYRRAVLLGGCFFALGFFLLGAAKQATFFYSGLICLCVGNGFFKPNISVMVGNLYQPGDPRRDAGFNIFYMGINIGAFVANFVAADVRNSLGWLWIFRTAGFGMLIGITILLFSWKALAKADRKPERRPEDTSFGQILGKILVPALLAGLCGYWLGKQFLPEGHALRPAVVGFLAGMLPIGVFFGRLAAKAPPAEKPGLLALFPVYLAGATFFMVLHMNGSAMTAWARDNTDRRVAIVLDRWKEDALPLYYSNAGPDEPRPNRQSLLRVASDETAAMLGQQRIGLQALEALVATLPEGVAVHEFQGDADDLEGEEKAWSRRGVDVYETVDVTTGVDAHGMPEITVAAPEGAKAVKRVAFLREHDGARIALVPVNAATWKRLYDDYASAHGRPPAELPPGEFMIVANSELFQSLNAFFVIALTFPIILLWRWLAQRGIQVSTAKKIFIGMVLTTAALLVMALAGWASKDGAAKVSWFWLVGFYFVITVAELCLSPMALSLVTKLSPKHLVGLTMGGWFLATSFGNNFSGFFGGLLARMAPSMLFLLLAGIAGAVALVILTLLPRLEEAMKRYGA